MVRLAALAPIALLCLLLASPAPAAAAGEGREPGVYWDSTIEMQMTGFSMPPRTTRMCMPKKSWEEPPKGGDEKCKATDVKRSGSRMTWKIKCEDGTTGEGEMTSTPDTYDGTMTMLTQGQEVRMKMKGKKVGGDCDAGEMKRKVAEMRTQAEQAQAQHAQSMEQTCREAADELNLQMFVPMVAGVPPTCPDPSRLCKQLDTRKGLSALKRQGEMRKKAEKLCKADLAALEKKHCDAAAKEQEKATTFADQDTLGFVFEVCDELARALAKRECAGRKYTAMPQAQRDFCARWAEKALRSGKAPAASAGAEEKADDKAKKKGAPEDADDGPEQKKPEDVKSKILKGLFGR